MRRSFRLRLSGQAWLATAVLLIAFGAVVRIINKRHTTELVLQQMDAIGNDLYMSLLHRGRDNQGPPAAGADRVHRLHGPRGRPGDDGESIGPKPEGGGGPPAEFVVIAADGRELLRSTGFSAEAEIPATTHIPVMDDMVTRRYGGANGRRPYRIGDFQRLTLTGQDYYRLYLIGQDGVVVILYRADAMNRQTQELDRALLLTLAAALLILVPLAWWQANRVLQPVRRITRIAQEIGDRSLDARISTDDTDREFHELIEVLNEMLSRLEQSFGQARRFSADAAHELRTPLTVLQGEIEAALNSADTGSAQQQHFSGLLDEVEHLKIITRKLLLLSLADASRLPLDRAPVNLSTLLPDLAEDAELLGQHLRVHCQIAPELVIQADADLLTQAIRNLLTNAVKYNIPPAAADPEQIVGIIVMQAGWDAPSGVIRIAIGNTGQVIAPADAERVFDRFYRADSAHQRKVAGAGLGLSLSAEIARAHSGTLTVALGPDRLTHPETGEPLTTFRLDLPPTGE